MRRRSCEHAPTARIGAQRVAEAMILTVEDDGPGIRPEERAAVFEAFRTGSSESPGTGLGLWLVARLAGLHGARLTLDEAPAGGARFRVTFPDPAVAGEIAPEARAKLG